MIHFYQKFQVFSRFPLWRSYLQKVYSLALLDVEQFKLSPLSKRKNCKVLLCGCASEITADEFITSVFTNNSDASIIIIDLGSDQVRSIQKLKNEKYMNKNISIKQANALNLSFIKDKSIDWIDTDGFFGFFDKNNLVMLLKEWNRILKDDGFITFRELIPQSKLAYVADRIRAFGARMYMGIDFHRHTAFELKSDFEKLQFNYSWKSGVIPFFSRFCIIKKR